MRQIQFAVAVLVMCALGSVDGAEPEKKGVPKSSDGWPMVLLSEPFHIGDQKMEDMVQVKPMGKQVIRQFDLDQGTRPRYVGVWLDSTVGPGHKHFKQGHYQIKLLINGKELAILNKGIRKRRTPGEPQKVVVRLSPTDFHNGVNDLVIKGGGKGKNISECEVHKIVLSLTRP